MTPEEAVRAADALLSEYWRERVGRAQTAEELRLAISDSHLRSPPQFPERPVRIGKLRDALEPRVAADRLEVVEAGRSAVVKLRAVTRETLERDLRGVRDAARKLSSHARLRRVEIEAPGETTLSVSVECEVPLENLLFVGEAPVGPRAAIRHGTLPGDASRLRVDDIACPACGARQVVIHGAKSMPQDREDIPFACLACCRCECTAHGIPELVGYRIDLVDRLPPKLARVYRRHRKMLADMARSAGPGTAVEGLVLAAWASVGIPAVVVGAAWLSDGFRLPAFEIARLLATFAVAAHGATIAVWLRSPSKVPANLVALTFAAVFALLIPVTVALLH